MEVGAVKQAFNTEVILLKKKLNQAKIQIIHKLTRKAKQLTEKKAPEQLKDKLKRKAESAVNEVLIIKKIKPKDLAKFIVTHKGELKQFLNKPQVDNDKACARLLLHKALQDKYKFIRGRFSNVPIQDLFMSRIERRKMKKDAKEKQKNKKKDKNSKVVNSEGDWTVEDVEMNGKSEVAGSENEENGDQLSGDEVGDSEVSGDESAGEDDRASESEGESDHSNTGSDENVDLGQESEDNNSKDDDSEDDEVEDNVSQLKLATPVPKTKTEAKQDPKPVRHEKNMSVNEPKKVNQPKPIKKNPEKKQKELNKNKNFNEKLLQKKFKKDSDGPVVENKTVDPFFITSSGENYMSVVEPRAPDEVKEEHKQGNRKLRRAVMFGHVPKTKPRYNNNYSDKYNNGNNFKSKFNDKPQFNERRTFNNDDRKPFNKEFNNRKGFNDRHNIVNDEKPEKLHPSWEAKKKKSGILPFEGKKIVFD